VPLLGMVDRVADYVCHVVVSELVRDLATSTNTFDEVGTAQHPKMLADEWLRQTEALDQLVDTALARSQLGNQGHPYR